MLELLLPALAAAAVVALLTPMVIRVATRYGVVDQPGGRRVHKTITPRLGGVAVLLGFFAVFLWQLPEIAPNFKPKQLEGFAIASAMLLLAGVIDDKRGLHPALQLGTHILAGLILVAVGMGINEFTNPFGGKLSLDVWNYPITLSGTEYHISLPADLLTVAWVVLVMNAVNWLDGIDGLATGVSAISATVLALLSVSIVVDQPHVALLSAILAGALGGFLIFNFQPAKIFLGTVGSTFIGFVLATLAIISGGKIATAVLVLGLPILDAMAIIIRRLAHGEAPWHADAKHLHHRLLAHGYSVRETVVLMYAISVAFGGLALLTTSTGQKFLAFGGLLVLMSGLLIWLTKSPSKPAPRSKQ